MTSNYSFIDHAVKTALDHTRFMNRCTITYSRDATTLTLTNASQGHSQKGTIEVGGQEQVVEIQEWMIGVADLAALGQPQAGDIIVRTIDGTSMTFTVECLQMGTPVWDYTDNTRSEFRIMARKDGASAFEVSEPTGFDLQGNEMRYE